jgi:hypothetical protein
MVAHNISTTHLIVTGCVSLNIHSSRSKYNVVFALVPGELSWQIASAWMKLRQYTCATTSSLSNVHNSWAFNELSGLSAALISHVPIVNEVKFKHIRAHIRLQSIKFSSFYATTATCSPSEWLPISIHPIARNWLDVKTTL